SLMHHLSVCLFLSFLSGVCYCRKTTINEVQVVRGASISIPCLYDSKYEKHVKYLCKGHYWRSCSYAVKTNKLDTNGNFLIQDVKEQKTFTVTINHVDTDSYYWFQVTHLLLMVCFQPGTPALRVDRQKMEGFRGGNITINCYSRSSGMRKWCKLGGNCVTSSFQLVDGRKVIINKNHSVYSVTMIGLKQENSGWYWCDQGQFQMPVHLTVTERPLGKHKFHLFKIKDDNRNKPHKNPTLDSKNEDVTSTIKNTHTHLHCF
uniref:Immunoglobulin domain-containing protein n=1 Tax=Oryzias melastigma TaxID=30732 RepID=A0A3B3BGL4_ORYME